MEDKGKKNFFSDIASKYKFYLLMTLIAVLVLFGAMLGYKTKEVFNGNASSGTALQLSPTYSEVDFKEVVLGESRSKTELLVLEQEISVESKITQGLFNIGVFSKTMTMSVYGTGYYVVDLSAVKDKDINVDMTLGNVSISSPKSSLKSVSVDTSRTTFTEGERGFLAFGDIKLNSEQQISLNNELSEAIEGELAKTENINRANEAAKAKTKKLYEGVVKKLAGDFNVVVLISEEM